MAVKPNEVLVVWARGNRLGIKTLQVPLLLALGKYEHLTDEELDDHAADIEAERARRTIDAA